MDPGMLPAVKEGKKQHKLGWSYGTDHPQNRKKMTCKLIFGQRQLFQLLEVSERLRDALAIKGGKTSKSSKNQVGRTGLTILK